MLFKSNGACAGELRVQMSIAWAANAASETCPAKEGERREACPRVGALSRSTDLEPRDRVRIVPNHSCVVSNPVDQAWLLNGAKPEPLEITARDLI